jgi:DNA primase
LYHILNSVYQRGSSPPYESVEQLVPSVLHPAIARARKSVESQPAADEAGQFKSADQCAKRLRRMELLQQNTELRYILQDAETTGDAATRQQLMLQLMENQRLLRTLYSSTHLQG